MTFNIGKQAARFSARLTS